jgi:hypothetical protein
MRGLVKGRREARRTGDTGGFVRGGAADLAVHATARSGAGGTK